MLMFLLSTFLSVYYAFCSSISSNYRGWLYSHFVKNLKSAKYLILVEILKVIYVFLIRQRFSNS